MSYTKEFLLFVATSVAGVGPVLIQQGRVWEGIGALVIAALLFVGRGFYKKYLADEKK